MTRIESIYWRADKVMAGLDNCRTEDCLEVVVSTEDGKRAMAYLFYAGMGVRGGQPVAVYTMWTFSGFVFPGSQFAEWSWCYDFADDLAPRLVTWMEWLDREPRRP